MKIPIPKIDGTTTQTQIMQIKNYLYQLVNILNTELEANNKNEGDNNGV